MQPQIMGKINPIYGIMSACLIMFTALLLSNGSVSGAYDLFRQPDAILPMPPSQIQVLETDQAIQLTWDNMEGAALYRVYRSTLAGMEYQLIGEVNANPLSSKYQYQDTGLINQATYYYRLTTLNDNGVESVYSREIVAVAYVNPWFVKIDIFGNAASKVIDYPSGGTAPVLISAEYFISGQTGTEGPAAGIRSQLILGPASAAPAAWTKSVNARYSGDGLGLNDQVQAAVFPIQLSMGDTILLTYRFSAVGSSNWVYLLDNDNELIQKPWETASNSSLWKIVFTQSGDTQPPTQPSEVSVAKVGTQEVPARELKITWKPSQDDVGLVGYDIFRADSPDIPDEDRILIARVNPASPPTFIDKTVTSGRTYYYWVKAVDTGYNYSLPSIPAAGTAWDDPVIVTINVSIPQNTSGDVYINRKLDLSHLPGDEDWQAQQMKCNWTEHSCTIPLTIQNGTFFSFLFSRGSQNTVQTQDGNAPAQDPSFWVNSKTNLLESKISVQTVEKIVYQWQDPQVAAYEPAGDMVDPRKPIRVIWDQSMPATSRFSVEEQSGVGPASSYVTVPGSFQREADHRSIVFIPTSPLKSRQTYRVRVENQPDVLNNPQQSPIEWIFTTGYYHHLRLPFILR